MRYFSFLFIVLLSSCSFTSKEELKPQIGLQLNNSLQFQTGAVSTFSTPEVYIGATILAPHETMEKFTTLNEGHFSTELISFMKNRASEVQKFGSIYRAIQKSKSISTFESNGIELYYLRDSLKPGQRVALWFVPYHFPGGNYVFPMERAFIGSNISPVIINLNHAQLNAENFDALYAKLTETIDVFLRENSINSVDVILTSMGSQWGMQWMNDHIDRVNKVYMNAALIKKTDTKRHGFLNQYTSDIQKLDIPKVTPVDNIVLADFFVVSYLYHLSKYHKTPGYERIMEAYKFTFFPSGVNWSLFEETWNRYSSGYIDSLPHLSLIRDKTACTIVYTLDTISAESDMRAILGENTQVLITPGEHNTAWAQPEAFGRQILECSK